jgi:hypothetical protein
MLPLQVPEKLTVRAVPVTREAFFVLVDVDAVRAPKELGGGQIPLAGLLVPLVDQLQIAPDASPTILMEDAP